MAATKRGTTPDGLGVYGLAGVMEYRRADGWFVFHRPSRNGDPCPVMEMACDPLPIGEAEDYVRATQDDEVFPVLEAVYATYVTEAAGA